MRQRVGRTSLLTRFGVISLVIIVILGITLAIALRRTLVNRTLEDAGRTAEVAAAAAILPLLEPADLTTGDPLSAGRMAQLDAGLVGVTSSQGILQMTIWNWQHIVIYAADPAMRGEWFQGPEELTRSLDDEITSQIMDVSGRPGFQEMSADEVVQVYVPLGVDGAPETATSFSDSPARNVVGAFEVYLPYAPIAAQIKAETWRLVLILALGLVVLWGLLFRVVASASRRLISQAETNRYLAEHDVLTGLPNRRSFTELIDQRNRAVEHAMTIALVDIRRFAELNDTMGHAVGDGLLQHVATTLREACTPEEYVARMGADEFGLLLPEPLEVAKGRIAVLVDAVQRPVEVEDIQIRMATTVGIASTEGQSDLAAEQILQQADIALYQAKIDGLTHSVFDPRRELFSKDRLSLAAQFRQALGSDQIEVVYQPQLNLRTHRVHSVEALVRWRHPVRGLLAPAAFLDVIEQTDLIRDLTERVLDLSLAQVRRWRDDGLRIRVSVNLSARDCINAGLPHIVEQTLARHELPSSALTCELTESAMLSNPEVAERVLRELHQLGVDIAVDDFGTGYASLAYVRRMPVSELKIDRSFIANLHAKGPDADVVRFTADLGRRLHLRVVAEGVELQADIDTLTEIGCNVVQGFHLTRPLDADAMTAWLRTAGTVRSAAAMTMRDVFDTAEGSTITIDR